MNQITLKDPVNESVDNESCLGRVQVDETEMGIYSIDQIPKEKQLLSSKWSLLVPKSTRDDIIQYKPKDINRIITIKQKL